MRRPRFVWASVLISVVALVSLACEETVGETPTSVTEPTSTVGAPAPLATPTQSAPAPPAAQPSTPTALASTPTTAPAPADPTPTTAVATATSVPATATPAPPSPTPAPSIFPLTITGSNDKEIVFETPPERIVAYSSAVVEILFAIGEGHRVVGTHDFVDYPPEADGIARVGSAFAVNVEAIVALEPDLVLIFSEGPLADLERAGLNVLYLESRNETIQGVTEKIQLWGRIADNVENAETVAAEFEARVAAIEGKLVDVELGPRVFQDEGSLWTPGPDTLIGDVFALLKLQSIAHDVTGYVQMSPEQIVERDPEVIIASYGDTISENPAFSAVSAVRDGRVFVPESNALAVAGPRFVDGIEEIARLVYPQLFE